MQRSQTLQSASPSHASSSVLQLSVTQASHSGSLNAMAVLAPVCAEASGRWTR